MKILTVIGARPQFIKASMVSRAFSQLFPDTIAETIVHTGQHYDHNMSGLFFEELGIPQPDYNLGVGSGSHGHQTGEMLASLEDVMLAEKPDLVLTYGDTNSTLAGALAASKIHLPIAHIEAGLRSFNRGMPEEINRILTDHVSTLLFCPTATAVGHLAHEGITQGVDLSGDVMFDSVLHFTQCAKEDAQACAIYETVGVQPGAYRLATLHRAETTDGGLDAICAIFDAFEQLPNKVVLPIHPRSRALASEAISLRGYHNILLIDPVGYLEMLLLTSGALQVLTDSGGLQKEAYFAGVPCITLRHETEWVETLVGGWNVLTNLETEDILEKALGTKPQAAARDAAPFGDGYAAQRIARCITGEIPCMR